MALVLCLACGLAAGLAALVLSGAEDGPVSAARMKALLRVARRGVGAVAETHVVELLLRHDALAESVESAVPHLPGDMCRTREEAAAMLLLYLGSSCIACGVVSGSPLGSLACLLVACVGMESLSSARRRGRARALAQEMPSVFRALATALESGSTLVQAIDYVGLHESGPAAEAFAHASLGLRCGLSVDEVLQRLDGELDAPGIGLMATALSISQRTGSPLRDLFRRSAVLVEREEGLQRTLAVRTAQVRLSVRVVCGLPALMVGLLSLISPDYRAGVSSGPGAMCLVVAVGLDALALLIVRRIMEGVL